MNNPFEQIDARLSNIESLLLDIKHGLIGKIDFKDMPITEFIGIFSMSTRLRNALLSLAQFDVLYMSEFKERYLGATGKLKPNRIRNIGEHHRKEMNNILKNISV